MKMEQKSHEMISSTTELRTDFQAVDGVVQSWMIDYYFTSLCRLFRERSAGKFRKTLNIFQATVDELESCSASRDHSTQRTICCFLARVMDGEELNVHYDKNDQISPLMSALKVWDLLEDLVSDPALHTKIRNLLIVQSVAVCVRNGKSQMGKDTLQWLEKEAQIPEKLHGKLTGIVNKKDAYDQLLMNLTYNQLLEKIDMFLDSQQDASHFLLEAAIKVVEARQERSDESSCEQDGGKAALSSLESTNNSKENDSQVDPLVVNNRHKKKLLSKQVDPWNPETAKKKQRLLRRSSVCKVTQRSSVPSVLESNISTTSRGRRKWTSKEDYELKAGVRQYGVGKWAVILNAFNLENRTSVMLKDRWRTLKKQNIV
ncbi:telomeric repeat-binding factor 1 [Triplophysa dalaica]|uniref:telomeric repeat-binding factor 1 n=1 Tax=Triplophysa dalaica TaxID=1582913 RepID=UPI0024DF6BD5|nr:telomeric repeat-binding factor 1 [Triplophysa dalaica]